MIPNNKAYLENVHDSKKTYLENTYDSKMQFWNHTYFPENLHEFKNNQIGNYKVIVFN